MSDFVLRSRVAAPLRRALVQGGVASTGALPANAGHAQVARARSGTPAGRGSLGLRRNLPHERLPYVSDLLRLS